MLGRKFIFLILFYRVLHMPLMSQNHPKDYFRSPLDIPLLLSGTFGELRSNHFHAGIDIKTQGVLDIKSEQLLMGMFLE